MPDGSRVPPRSFFSPESIAVVGASPRKDTPVNRLLSTLLARGFRGRVYPVTDRHSTVEGLATAPAPAKLPEPVDLGIVAMPKELAVGACGRLADVGVRNIVVVSAGFAESGPDGVVRQRELADLAAERGLFVLGPNCMGFVNLLDGVVPCFASVVINEPSLLPGRAAIISQSGGVGIAAMLAAMRAGTGVSHVISSGNEAVLDQADLLDYVVADGRSAVVLLYAEHFRRGSALLDAVGRASAAGIGVVLLHGGRLRAGALAAQSHTGALTTDGRVVRELAGGAGAWPVHTLGEAVEALGALASGSGVRPRGRRVAALATSGGLAVLSADAVASADLTLATPAESTKDVLRAASPGFSGPWNPIDITPELYYRPDLVRELARSLAEDSGVDSVLLCGTFAYESSVALAEAFATSLAGSGKAVAAGWLSGDDRIAKTFRDNGLAYFTDVSTACGYLATGDAPLRVPTPSPPARPDGGEIVTEERVKAELRALGLAVPDSVIAEGVAGLGELRPPVAVKGLHGLFPHKAQAGVLALDLADDHAVRQACARIGARMRARGIDRPRVLIEEMVAPGVELFVGGRVDPAFGRIGVVGFGGSGISGQSPTRLVSLRSGSTEGPVAEALAGLEEKVGCQPREEIVRVVATILDWWSAHGQLAELDVNPLIVNESGIWVVDGLAVRQGRTA